MSCLTNALSDRARVWYQGISHWAVRLRYKIPGCGEARRMVIFLLLFFGLVVLVKLGVKVYCLRFPVQLVSLVDKSEQKATCTLTNCFRGL